MSVFNTSKESEQTITNKQIKKRQFLTLLKKEFWTHKKTVFMPAYFLGAFYAILLLLCIVGFLNGSFQFESIGVSLSDYEVFGLAGMENSLLFWGFGMLNAVITFVLVLFIHGGLTNSLVNDDFKHKCVLFHSSFPVSMANKILAKFTFIFSSLLAIGIGLILVNTIILLPILTLFIKNINIFEILKFYFLGMLQGSILWICTGMFWHSSNWLFSATFKEKTMSRTLGVLAVIFALSVVVSIIFSFNFLEIFMSLVIQLHFPKIVYTPLGSILGDFFSMKNLILDSWGSIFNGMMIIRLSLSTVFYAVGSYLIWKRDIV